MHEANSPPIEQAVCRIDDNVLDTGTVPLIFVPGVMGSRIVFAGKTWDPDANLNMVGWSQVEPEDKFDWFDAGHPGRVRTDSDDLSAEQIRRGWAGVSWKFYGQFILDLQAHRFGSYTTPVYAVGYDWRQSNRRSGRYLGRKINAILEHEGVERYILVSHSMGGLVTRSFLKDNPEGLRDKCLGIIHIAQPVNGGVVLVRRLFCGASMRYDGGYGIEGYVFSRILGTSRRDAVTITAGMPGPLQLLVTDHYRDRDGSGRPISWYDRRTFENPSAGFVPWTGNIWNLYTQPQSPPGLLPPPDQHYSPSTEVRTKFSQSLTLARNFHNWLGLWKYENKTWSIYSTGRTVDTRIPFDLPPQSYRMEVPMTPYAMPYYLGRRANGSEDIVQDPNPEDRGLIVTQTAHSDGTVPMMSARGLFPGEGHRIRRGTDYDTHHQFEVNDPDHDHAGHDAICRHPEAETATFDIIEHLLGI
jgi:pimeloyl-ACP methyl ester carboxylesterase